MGKGKHNHTISNTERRLSSGAESFPSSIDSQNKNQAQNQRLFHANPASRLPGLCPQPGQNNRSTPVAIAHRFDPWGRNPAGNQIARLWQKCYRFANSEGEETIETAINQSPYFFVNPGDLAPERKIYFEKNFGGKK